jgi:hypothetical protein
MDYLEYLLLNYHQLLQLQLLLEQFALNNKKLLLHIHLEKKIYNLRLHLRHHYFLHHLLHQPLLNNLLSLNIVSVASYQI